MQMVDSCCQECTECVWAKISASALRQREALKRRRKQALDECDGERGAVEEEKGAERRAALAGQPSRQAEQTETAERRAG
jgi:hypothetical protein